MISRAFGSTRRLFSDFTKSSGPIRLTRESVNTVSYGESSHFHTPGMTHTISDETIKKEDINSGESRGNIRKLHVNNIDNNTTASLTLYSPDCSDQKNEVTLQEGDKNSKLFFPNEKSKVQTTYIANFFKAFSKNPDQKHVQEISNMFCHAAQHDDIEEAILKDNTISKRTVRV